VRWVVLDGEDHAATVVDSLSENRAVMKVIVKGGYDVTISLDVENRCWTLTLDGEDGIGQVS